MSRWSRWAPAKLARRVQARQQHWQQRFAPYMPKPMRSGSPPGSAQSLVDAIALNKWNRPYGSEANSFDVYAGGFSSDDRRARAIGRTVGTVALIWTGAAWASSGGAGAGTTAGAGGAEQVGIGYPVAAEAGAGTGASAGLIAEPAATGSIFSSLPSVSAQEVSTAALVWKMLSTGNIGGAVDALTGTDWGSTFLGAGGGEGGGGAARMGIPEEEIGGGGFPPIMLIIGGIAALVGGFFLIRKLKG